MTCQPIRDQLATDQVRLVRAAMILMRWAFTSGQCGALAGGLQGGLERPGFRRRRRPVAVGIFVPCRAAHPRDNRPFGRGQVGVVVEEEAL